MVFNLSFLAYFKYANFFIAETNLLFSAIGVNKLKWAEVILPIGISFFTFHEITYVVDLYRNKRQAFTSFIDFALYVAMFPQLIAGPIVRFHEISEQIVERRESLDGFFYGTMRFSLGLIKKVIIANQCAEIADAVFSLGNGALDTKTAWLGVFAYTLQIYFDFSAYSDMAIGLGNMFGFQLPENFNRPYSAVSITDFWRRWHITLSRFFRDYVYIPLGGNRRSASRTYLNLIIVFLLCGMWHGANWTFLVWGVYHGVLLIIERTIGVRDTEVGFIFLRRLMTLLLVMSGWVLFRARDIGHAASYLSAMFWPSVRVVPVDLAFVINPRNIFFLCLAALVFFLPRNFSGSRLLTSVTSPYVGGVRYLILFVMVLYSVALLASGSFNPFIYFQF